MRVQAISGFQSRGLACDSPDRYAGSAPKVRREKGVKQQMAVDRKQPLRDTQARKAKLIRRMYDNPERTGVGSAMDNELHDLESLEVQQQDEADGIEYVAPCGDKATFKMGVGAYGCWHHDWMYSPEQDKWFK